MKKSTAGKVTAGILIFVAGIGFGIAQAGGNHADSPAYGFEDQEALQVVNAPEEDMDQEPLFVANAPEEDMDLAEPIGVGTLPSGSDMDTDDANSRDQGEYTSKR